MELIECTSGASLWRGYDYYKDNKVKNLIETSPGVFTAFPEEAQRIYNEAMAYQDQADKHAEEPYEMVRQCVWKMKKSEAQQALLEVLFDGPEWQFDRFVREHDLEDDYY